MRSLRVAILVALSMTVAGCASLAPFQPKPSVTTVQVCASIRDWTPEEQLKLLDELEKAGPYTERAVGEFILLRDQVKKCIANKRR